MKLVEKILGIFTKQIFQFLRSRPEAETSKIEKSVSKKPKIFETSFIVEEQNFEMRQSVRGDLSKECYR